MESMVRECQKLLQEDAKLRLEAITEAEKRQAEDQIKKVSSELSSEKVLAIKMGAIID
jgi:hypothetical protein